MAKNKGGGNNQQKQAQGLSISSTTSVADESQPLGIQIGGKVVEGLAYSFGASLALVGMHVVRKIAAKFSKKESVAASSNVIDVDASSGLPFMDEEAMRNCLPFAAKAVGATGIADTKAVMDEMVSYNGSEYAFDSKLLGRVTSDFLKTYTSGD